MKDMLEIPQSYKRINAMAREAGLTDRNYDRGRGYSDDSYVEPSLEQRRQRDARRDARRRQDTTDSDKYYERPVPQREDTRDSVVYEDGHFRRRDSGNNDALSRNQSRRRSTYDSEKLEAMRRYSEISDSRAPQPRRQSTQFTDISDTPETKLVAKHLHKAQEYITRTRPEDRDNVAIGRDIRNLRKEFGDLPLSASPTPMEQDEVLSMMPEHGSTPSPTPPSRPKAPNGSKPNRPVLVKRPTTEYQQPTVVSSAGSSLRYFLTITRLTTSKLTWKTQQIHVDSYAIVEVKCPSI